MKGAPHGYQRRGFILVAILVTLVVALGWRAASVIRPGSIRSQIAPAGETASGKQFLVYMTSTVTDRGTDDAANDDEVTYDFLRLPLDGADVTERIAHVVHDDQGDRYTGSPLMRKVSSDTLLFDRRDTLSGAPLSWMDVSGTTLPLSTSDPAVLHGLPSPDGTSIAYVDYGRDAVSILTFKDGLTRSFATDGYLLPVAWTPDSSIVYLTPVSEGDRHTSGLWKLDMRNEGLSEIRMVRELGLTELSFSADAHIMTGVTFQCESLESCGIGPSSLYVVDLVTETVKTLLENEISPYRMPHITPDGSHIAYTFGPDLDEVRVVDFFGAGDLIDRRIITGHVLDWTPDGQRLVVERNNALQLVNVATGNVVTVAQRSGVYRDPDYKGLEYIGIIQKR